MHLIDYWGCLVRCETDFVQFLGKFWSNANEGPPKFDKICQIKGERGDFDGQINQKINEVLT